MIYLFLFIFGILFADIILPILDSISTYLQNIFGLQSVILQAKSQKVQSPEPTSTHAIGFQVPSEEQEEEEYE